MMIPDVEKFLSPKTPWEVFQQVYRSSRDCFFLDSLRYAPPDQVYSYIGMDPALTLYLEKGMVRFDDGTPKKYPAGKLFPVLKRILRTCRITSSNPFPFFTGGLVGYWGYDLAELCDKIHFDLGKKSDAPRLWLGLFRDVIVYDHQKKVYYLAVNHRAAAARRRGMNRLKAYFNAAIAGSRRRFRLGKIASEISEQQFTGMVAKAKEYIAAGDIYQANLSQRFSFDFSGPTLELYGKLRTINPSPFSCFLRARNLEVISSSPERLIQKKGRMCETRPIAGTCPAHGPRRQLRKWRQKLLRNEKEKAEHLMLVDLERNDLGRVCDYRSVRVAEFMVLEKYSHVVHIVSKIVGRLKKGKDALDLLKAMFPGGTITGCPKIRCMEIIDELEPVNRGLYTGSMGYLDLYGDMDLNIVIRTLILRKNRGSFQVGAGIVHDSIPKKEYEETLHKAEALMKALRESGKDAY